MLKSFSIAHKGVLLVAIPVLFELIFVLSLGALLADQNLETDRLERGKEILLDIHAMEAGFIRNFALLAGDQSTKLTSQQLDEEFDRITEKINKARLSYHDLAILRPQIKGEIQSALELLDKGEAMTIKANKIYRDPSISQEQRVRYFRDQTTSIVLESKPLIAEIVQTENNVQAKAPEIQKALFERLAAAIVVGLVVNVIVALGLALSFSKDFVERIATITADAKLLPLNKELPPQMDGRDEIAKLDQILHNSADMLFETRRKESAILNQAADVIFCLDTRGRFTDVGLPCVKIWQYDPAELIGSPIYSFLPSQDGGDLRKFIEANAEPGNENREEKLETRMIRQDGSVIDLLLSIKWSERDKFYACVAHDDSARKAIERMKQRFLAMVSHDLRTPLTSVSSSFELLLEGVRGPLSEKVLVIVKRALENIRLLLELINELLEIEKLESGITLEKTAVSAHDVCVAAKELVQSFATASRISIQGPHGDAVVVGNERRLIQALTNLLSNAIKFSPPDSTVTLSITVQSTFVELAVTDQGPGVPESDRSIIFEKFKQSRAQTTTAVKSTGLGLALVKATAEAHNGQAGVTSSTTGRGSRFFLRLAGFNEVES